MNVALFINADNLRCETCDCRFNVAQVNFASVIVDTVDNNFASVFIENRDDVVFALSTDAYELDIFNFDCLGTDFSTPLKVA